MKNVEKNCSRSVIKNRTTSVLLYYMHKPNKVRKSQRCKVDVQTNAHSLCCSYIYLWPFNQILKLLAVHHLLCKGKKSDCVYCDDPGTHKGLSSSSTAQNTYIQIFNTLFLHIILWPQFQVMQKIWVH